VDLLCVSVEDVTVSHLGSYVEMFELAGGESIKIRVIYSSHCWSKAFDAETDQDTVRFMDGNRARAFCPDRFELSLDLRRLIERLPRNRIYMTAAERNFGTYCATEMLEDGRSYTAFFTIRRGSGRFDGIRHKLTMHIESAYLRPQPDPIGQKAGFTALISAALNGKSLSFKR
jgi:hypothetical protein